MVRAASWMLCGLGLALVALVGSACQPSRVAAHFGEAQRGNIARMAQNPEAELAPASEVEGLDPLTGEVVVENYQREQGESQESGAEALPTLIDVSTGSR